MNNRTKEWLNFANNPLRGVLEQQEKSMDFAKKF